MSKVCKEMEGGGSDLSPWTDAEGVCVCGGGGGG